MRVAEPAALPDSPDLNVAAYKRRADRSPLHIKGRIWRGINGRARGFGRAAQLSSG